MSAIVSSDSGNYDVYLGFWINWSLGKIKGATLTTTKESGGLLIAFIALYVSTSGRSFWRVSCFFLHRLFSSYTPMDGLYHTRQIILRNADTAAQATTSLLCALGWRKRASRPIRRVLPVLLYAAVVWAAFTVSGLFSSRITTNTANEVLLTGKNCGILWRGLMTKEMQELYMETADLNEAFSSQRTAAYNSYASQCYPTARVEQSESCRPYVKPKLSYTITRNATCPFDDEICRLKSENLILDSGQLESHDDFGLNSPKGKRFSFRVRSQCAPLVTEGFSKIHSPEDDQYMQSVRYYYGQALGVISTKDNSFTFQVPYNVSSRSVANYTSMQVPNPDYVIGTTDEQFFAPIKQLNRTEGDRSLVFLSAPGLLFTEQTDDPWFSAHTVDPTIKTYYGNDTRGTSVYRSDEAAGVIGCVSQYSFCNPALPAGSQCSTLGSSGNSYEGVPEQLWSDKDDQQYARWGQNLILLSLGLSPVQAYKTAGISALTVRSNLKQGLQTGKIPKDQWQLEMAHVFEVMLASLQGSFLDNINGPSPEFAPAFARPNDTAWKYMCKNQKIVSTLYYSFNVLGLSVILVIGGIFIILENTLEILVNWIDKRPKRSDNPQVTYTRLEWHSNATLQLHRLAHEEAGYATWEKCEGLMPITAAGEKLGMLDIRDQKHARIQRANHGLRTVNTFETMVGSDDGSMKKVEVDIRRVDTEEDIANRNSMLISPVPPVAPFHDGEITEAGTGRSDHRPEQQA